MLALSYAFSVISISVIVISGGIRGSDGKQSPYFLKRQDSMTKAFEESFQFERILEYSESKDDAIDFEESTSSIEDDNDDGFNFSIKDCYPVGECELCSGSSLNGFTGCGLTGRRQKYACTNSGTYRT